MAGRNFLTSQTQRQSIQRSELQTTVAGNTRNGRLAVQITRDERLNHVALKVALQIQNVKRKAELFSNATSVVNVVERAATRGQRVAVFINIDAPPLVPELHRKANQLVSLILQNCRGRGRIHATTHCP